MAPSSGPILVGRIEANQVVQTFNDTVPLVSGKGTWVRVYLDSVVGDVSNVTGTLEATDSSGNTTTYGALNGPIAARESGSERIKWADIDLEAAAASSVFQSDPVWLSQVQTSNDDTFVRTRQRETDRLGMDVALENAEAKAGDGHGSESIGWLAIERGHGTADGVDYDAGQTWTKVAPSGDATAVSPPGSMEPNTLEHDDYALVFPEGTTTTNTAQPVDITSPGTYDAGNLSGGQLPSGQYDSYALNFDPEGTSTVESVQGSFTFPNKIQAIVASDSNLDSTDSVFGRGDLTSGSANTYASPGSERDLDLRDSITLENDQRTLSFDLEAQNAADQLRVITASGPSDPDIQFEQNFSSTPRLLASLSSYNGGNAVGLRRDAIDSDGATVSADEDRSQDNETDHINETVDYLALDGSGTITGYPYVQGAQPGQTTSLTETTYDTPANSGQVTSGGTVNLATQTATIPIGDTAADTKSHGLFEFDLNDLPSSISPSDIKDADLSLSFASPNGNPQFSDINVVHAYYGSSIEAADYRGNQNLTLRPGLSKIPANPGFGTQTVDVTRAVKDAVTYQGTTDPIQFAVYHQLAGGVSGDDEPDTEPGDKTDDGDDSGGTTSSTSPSLNNGQADNHPIETGTASGRNRPTLQIKYEQPTLPSQKIGEVGTVTNLDTTEQQVSLNNSYNDPVVFAQPATENGGDAVAVRIDDVTGNSFDIRLQEPGGTAHNRAEDVDYAVMEAGSWQLKDGTHIEVGKTDTDITANEPARHADDTLNFFIPGQDSQGTLQLTPKVNSPNASTNASSGRSISFNQRDSYDVAFVDVRYTFNNNNATPDNNAGSELAGSGSRIDQIFPTGTINFQNTGRQVTIGKDLSGSAQNQDANWADIYQAVNQMRQNSSLPGDTDWYAIIPEMLDSQSSLKGVHWTNGVMAGIEGLETTFAHEAGHAIGRPHTPAGLPANRDPDYPIYADLTDEPFRYGSIGGVGLRNTDDGLATVDPRQYNDFMGYARSWMSPYNYQKLFDDGEFQPPQQPSLSPDPATPVADALKLTGIFSADRTASDTAETEATEAAAVAEVSPGYVMPAPRVSTPDEDGAYALVFRGSEGDLLREHPFSAEPGQAVGKDTTPDTDAYDSGAAFFSLTVPFPAETARIEIVDRGGEGDAAILAERTVSENAPEAALGNVPEDGATLREPRAIAIDTADPDGDAVTSILQFSPDGGETWDAIAVGLTGDSVTIDPDALPATEAAKLRLLASDGINTTTAVSTGTFVIDNSEPAPVINQAGVTGRDTVILQGAASDVEDGRVASAGLTWRSSEDGELGTGEEIVAHDLSSGSHTITLSATDSDGATVSTEREIVIEPAQQPDDGDGPGSDRTFNLEDATPAEQVAALYTAYYDRPSGPEGFAYWTDRHADARAAGRDDPAIVAEFASRFADAEESLATYPFLANPDPDGADQFITSVFQQLFNRDPGDTALDFYSDRLLTQLENDAPIGDIVLDILNGASGQDGEVLANKVEVALAFTETVDQQRFADIAGAGDTLSSLLSDVTADDASVANALDRVETLGQSPVEQTTPVDGVTV